MKKMLSVLCAAAILFTTVAIGVSANEVVTPENQDPSIATTIVCSSKPTTVMNYATNAQRRSIASVSKNYR